MHSDIFFIQYKIVIIQIFPLRPSNRVPECISYIVFRKCDEGYLIDPFFLSTPSIAFTTIFRPIPCLR